MTLVKIDIKNVASETHPDDRVVFYSPTFREAPGGGVTSTAETVVPLVDGVGEIELVPGPVTATFQCRGISDTRPKSGTVPEVGPVGIEEVIAGAFEYLPPVVNQALATIQGAVNAAVDSIKWVRRALVTDENLNSVVDNGLYNAPTSTLSATIINKPPAANNNPFTLEVQEISRINQVLLQIFTQGTTGDVRQWVRYRLGDTWQPWSQSIFSTSEQSDWRWVKAPLTASEDLNSLTGEGMRHAETYAVGNSILNAPAGSTGQPFSVEVRALSTTNGIRHQIFTQGTGGTLSQWIRYSISGVWQDWQQTITPKVSWNPSVPVYFWGDSAVDGGDTNGGWAAGENLPSRLGALVDNEVVNRGQSGRTSNDILLRAGVWRPAFTPVSGTLPYQQYVDLVGHGLALESRESRALYPGKLGGVGGTLRYEPGVGWQFYRSDTKDPGTITKPLEFVSSLSVPPGTGTHIFLMAGNDWIAPDATGPEHDLVTHVVANYVRAVESVGADPIRHVLIGGVKSRRSTQPGDASHRFVTEVNNRLKAMFPEIFVDREAWLATRALAAAGIAPTSDDVAKMAAGIAPPSVFAAGDDTHVRKEVVQAEARELWAPALARKGWATLKSGVTVTPWAQPAFGGYATQSALDLRVPVGAVAGTGTPEGRIAATVGTTYTDTAATNGAIRWIKTAGTGSTGWKVEYGDTGWRDITASAGSSVQMAPGGKIHIRRVGHVVYYKITGMKATSTYGQAVTVPTGFRTAATQVSADMSTDQPANARWQVTQYQVAYVNGTVDKMLALANEEIIIQVVTDNSWPTTPPDTPA